MKATRRIVKFVLVVLFLVVICAATWLGLIVVGGGSG